MTKFETLINNKMKLYEADVQVTNPAAPAAPEFKKEQLALLAKQLKAYTDQFPNNINEIGDVLNAELNAPATTQPATPTTPSTTPTTAAPAAANNPNTKPSPYTPKKTPVTI
jgi:hypothetical protein